MKNDKKNEPILPEETVKDVVKRGGNNPTGIGGFGSVDTTPGDNARYLRHSLTMLDLPALFLIPPVQDRLCLWQVNLT